MRFREVYASVLGTLMAVYSRFDFGKWKFGFSNVHIIGRRIRMMSVAGRR